jgi:uncharacterized membrane protein
MELSKHRFEFFSDGVMAIVITIVVLEIPLPKDTTIIELISFAKSILIFGISFFIVGYFWNKHHQLTDNIDRINNKIVRNNLIFLFFLAILPLFTRWVFENPDVFIPVISYDILFVLTLLTHLFIEKEASINLRLKTLDQAEQEQLIEAKYLNAPILNAKFYLIVGFILLIGIILAYMYPQVIISIMILFPIIIPMLHIVTNNTHI